MKYPTTDDEIMKQATMSWMVDQFDGDEDSARKYVKMMLSCLDLYERGFTWTDI